MNSQKNILLKNYTTMRLGGPAAHFIEVTSPKQLPEILTSPQFKDLPIFIIGGGSNVIAYDEGFDGLILHMAIPGFEILNDDKITTTIKVGAGESWDETVRATVEKNLSGIECLSKIPGTVGAAPVQNIGAYGQELADTFISLEAYDRNSGQFVTLDKEACGFGYRHSIFRGESKEKYIITSVTLQLRKSSLQPPFYESLQNYLTEQKISDYSPASLRLAVSAIRADKLPDPKLKPNSGSFFKNVIVSQSKFNEIKQHFPEIKFFPAPNNQVKIPTGWLIEQCGFKGQLLNGIRVHDKNALVLINESAHSTQDLIATRDTIAKTVQQTFNVVIEQEPLHIRI